MPSFHPLPLQAYEPRREGIPSAFPGRRISGVEAAVVAATQEVRVLRVTLFLLLRFFNPLISPSGNRLPEFPIVREPRLVFGV